MGRQSRKSSVNNKKNSTNNSKSCKRNFVSKTNINQSESAVKLPLTEAEIKISAGDTRLDPYTTPEPNQTDPQYWGDDELDSTHSDFDIIGPRRCGPVSTMEQLGCHYCGHCGIIPVERSGQYCMRCKETKREWLPDAPTRKLRQKVYKTTSRAPSSPLLSPNTKERTKHKSIKSKLKSLIKNRCGQKPVQPPLSKFSNLKCYRRSFGHFQRSRSRSSSSTGTGNSVLQAKAKAFRKRRDFYFYKHHKYQSDNS